MGTLKQNREIKGEFSLEELLAGRRATVGAVSGEETTEAVCVSVPGAVARCPGKWRLERVKQVVERPADEHHVVGGEDKGNNDSGQTDTCRVTTVGTETSEGPLGDNKSLPVHFIS